MAPINPDLQNVQEDIKNVIQDLFQVLVQVSNYDTTPGRPTRDALVQDFQTLDTTLAQLHTNAHHLPTPSANKGIPEPLIEYVENGRNPDIYTREFVELVRRTNQLARGKAHAFGGFRDVLAREMSSALPELRADVARVVEGTGGVTTAAKAEEEEGAGAEAEAEAEVGEEGGERQRQLGQGQQQ
ncbi:transcription factor subunit Med10 of mediator complex-domain-containing protein [Chaetomidium leptoderma]|uniref:Mediator of RNA polymerase II transcription subunit 10 n=1 Tax=Chaetomidium leptoderma TaxID=669021 RepID=A0AAN6VPU8_9PEZI|nr:transcription factor subunit Med10 of mediator complex-domain-containing protein [Chaetomidium leptoderma]